MEEGSSAPAPPAPEAPARAHIGLGLPALPPMHIIPAHTPLIVDQAPTVGLAIALGLGAPAPHPAPPAVGLAALAAAPPPRAAAPLHAFQVPRILEERVRLQHIREARANRLRSQMRNFGITTLCSADDDDNNPLWFCMCCKDRMGFVNGERLRKLGCRHVFHELCIERWWMNLMNADPRLDWKTMCPQCCDILGR